MAPPPEYDKEPKAPDKSATNISCEETKALHNLVNDQQTNSDTKPSATASGEVENNKHVDTLDDRQLRALLDEAYTYKCPKDREGKSNLFKELLEEVEQDEQACEEAARGPRGGRRGGGGRAVGRGRCALPHSNSLQDLVAAALAAEPAPRRHRPAPPVSARAIHGGSLPSGVDTSFLLSEEPPTRGANYLATVRCVNPPPLAERRVSASDANCVAEVELLNRRSKPAFPMTYTARATLEIGSGSVCSGRAVTTTTASNQVRTTAPRRRPQPPQRAVFFPPLVCGPPERLNNQRYNRLYRPGKYAPSFTSPGFYKKQNNAETKREYPSKGILVLKNVTEPMSGEDTESVNTLNSYKETKVDPPDSNKETKVDLLDNNRETNIDHPDSKKEPRIDSPGTLVSTEPEEIIDPNQYKLMCALTPKDPKANCDTIDIGGGSNDSSVGTEKKNPRGPLNAQIVKRAEQHETKNVTQEIVQVNTDKFNKIKTIPKENKEIDFVSRREDTSRRNAPNYDTSRRHSPEYDVWTHNVNSWYDGLFSSNETFFQAKDKTRFRHSVDNNPRVHDIDRHNIANTFKTGKDSVQKTSNFETALPKQIFSHGEVYNWPQLYPSTSSTESYGNNDWYSDNLGFKNNKYYPSYGAYDNEPPIHWVVNTDGIVKDTTYSIGLRQSRKAYREHVGHIIPAQSEHNPRNVRSMTIGKPLPDFDKTDENLGDDAKTDDNKIHLTQQTQNRNDQIVVDVQTDLYFNDNKNLVISKPNVQNIVDGQLDFHRKDNLSVDDGTGEENIENSFEESVRSSTPELTVTSKTVNDGGNTVCEESMTLKEIGNSSEGEMCSEIEKSGDEGSTVEGNADFQNDNISFDIDRFNPRDFSACSGDCGDDVTELLEISRRNEASSTVQIQKSNKTQTFLFPSIIRQVDEFPIDQCQKYELEDILNVSVDCQGNSIQQNTINVSAASEVNDDPCIFLKTETNKLVGDEMVSELEDISKQLTHATLNDEIGEEFKYHDSNKNSNQNIEITDIDKKFADCVKELNIIDTTFNDDNCVELTDFSCCNSIQKTKEDLKILVDDDKCIELEKISSFDDKDGVELTDFSCYESNKKSIQNLKILVGNEDAFAKYLAEQQRLFSALEDCDLVDSQEHSLVSSLGNSEEVQSDVEKTIFVSENIENISEGESYSSFSNNDSTVEEEYSILTEAESFNEVVLRLNAAAGVENFSAVQRVIAELPNNAYVFLTFPQRLLSQFHLITEQLEIELESKKKKDKMVDSARKQEVANRTAFKTLLFENVPKRDSADKSITKRLPTIFENEVDSAIPFSCITTPEVVASCNTTSSTSQSTVAVDPKPLQLGSSYRAVASLTGEPGAAPLAAPLADQVRVACQPPPGFGPLHRAGTTSGAACLCCRPAPAAAPEQPRSVISSNFNGLPLSRPNYGSTASTTQEEYKKSLDENGNSVQGYSSPLSGSSQHKKLRRKKSSKNETVIKSHQIDGYQGNKDLNEVLRFIESNADSSRAHKLPRAKHKDDADDKGSKKRSTERRKEKENKMKRATSMEELSRTKLEDLTDKPAKKERWADGAAPKERRSWGDDSREPFYYEDTPPDADFQTVTKKRKPRRRTDETGEGGGGGSGAGGAPDGRTASPRTRRVSAPPSERSNDSNDDMDSVHSLPADAPPARAAAPPPPAPPPAPAPQSYADIARTRHNIPDLIESCNFYAEGDASTGTKTAVTTVTATATAGGAAPAGGREADGYPALEPRPARRPRDAKPAPPPPARRDRKQERTETARSAPAASPAPDVVADRRPPVILLDSAARPRDMDGVTFGFDINEQLLGGPTRRPRCDLVRDAMEGATTLPDTNGLLEPAPDPTAGDQPPPAGVTPAIGGEGSTLVGVVESGVAVGVCVAAGCLALRYVAPAPAHDLHQLNQIVDYVGAAWEDVLRCGGGKVRYFSE